MGKYMKKVKSAGNVLVKDLLSSPGVCTRSKALALQRLQSIKPDSCYLELRSRRLEKPPLLRQCMQPCRKVSSHKQWLNCGEKEGILFESFPIDLAEEDDCFERRNGGFESGDLDVEGSCGENCLESEAKERSTRESTPCSFISTPPGSTTKPAINSPANQRPQDVFLSSNMPTASEIEEFFAQAEQSQHRQFSDKYNFDIVNDLPLTGQYEWEILLPISLRKQYTNPCNLQYCKVDDKAGR